MASFTLTNHSKQVLHNAAETIRKRPKKLDMECWFDCGTACCLAGQIQVNAGLPREPAIGMDRRFKSFVEIKPLIEELDLSMYEEVHTSNVAALLLGAQSTEDIRTIEQLFNTSSWPRIYESMYSEANTDRQRAGALCQLITKIIELGYIPEGMANSYDLEEIPY